MHNTNGNVVRKAMVVVPGDIFFQVSVTVPFYEHE